ncbi:hypothetical protein [Bacillus alkalicellulosilyticus]|uniref:hypothetical protein n=1 Tax=Alkalihalobacterium alkalicellulosilyticum TaxID=1912214 RepID=UPI001482B5E4|nr:hypothetical protein [Bacillus alkalicellulosilyticus]
MPHHKHRGEPLDLVLGSDEVSQEFASELTSDHGQKVKVAKPKKSKNKKNHK